MRYQIQFPDPRSADANGIVAVSETVDAEFLAAAYPRGIFPWPLDGFEYIPWFSPPMRAVLDFDRLNVPRSLRRERRKTELQFTLDKAFVAVIENCATIKRAHEAGTWITTAMQAAYIELHARGQAHSVEAWTPGGKLVGGLYGVDAGGAFAGESMFHLQPNASKLALLFLIEHLAARGATWLDAQVMTTHLEMLGARNITREEFLLRLHTTQSKRLRIFD